MKFEELLKMPLQSKMEKEGFFYEMPNFDSNFGGQHGKCILSLYCTEGDNKPHFHVESTQNKFKTAIRLDVPECFLHSDSNGMLKRKEIKRLITTLKSLDKTKRSIWEVFANEWNAHHPKNIIDNKEMPDYRKLPYKN